MKYCIVCKHPFEQRNSLERVCSMSCAIEYKNSLSTTIKKRKPIKKVSDKMAINLREYKKVRTEFLTLHPNCQANLKDCSKVATQIHHQCGRIGKLLNNSAYFLAVCHNCHHWIELHPVEAKEKGFSLDRF